MTCVLVDANVILDVLLDRQPHVRASAALWAAIEHRRGTGMIAAHAVTTIHYLIRKERGARFARRSVSALLRVFGVAPVNSEVLQRALELDSSDFEDAVTAAAAELAKCQAIVTRDPRGFAGVTLRALSPEAALAGLFTPGA